MNSKFNSQNLSEKSCSLDHEGEEKISKNDDKSE